MPEDAREQVAENAAAFERLVAVVSRRVAAGRWDSAAAWTRVATAFATTNPHGALREVRLDRALDTVARATLSPATPHTRAVGAPRRVLHVVSEGHLIGGHVRLALRWVEADEESQPHVLFTRPQCGSPELAAAVERRGGAARVLERRSLIERARELRTAASAADVVVCHTHPDDPVPALAFGGDYDGAPVVMVNHADHVFWLGVGNVAVVMNLREMGAEATISARGYPAANITVAPTPLPGVARGLERDAAKRRLGIDPAQTVLVTLARPIKYAPAPWHPGFVEVVAPVLRELPGATLVAVGADPTGAAWSSLQRELRGRVLLPGLLPDPSVHLDAADVYLDSFPFGSVTSMLEAATRDVPVLASRAYHGLNRLMSSSGVLDDVVIRGRDTAAYRAQLRRLIAEPTLRKARGAATGAAVRARHGSSAWQAHPAAVYSQAERVDPVLTRLPPDADTSELAEYAELLISIERQAPLLWTIWSSSDGFDAVDQLSSLVRTSTVRVVQRLQGRGAGVGAAMGRLLIPHRGIG